MKYTNLLMACMAIFCSCQTSRQSIDNVGIRQSEAAVSVPEQPFVRARRPIVIYRTKSDYAQQVPVMLDAMRKQITSYPAPGDVGEYSVPLNLGDGYLFDRRGIGARVAYTSYTYAEYAQLKQVPSQGDLLERIVEKEPLVEMWECSKAYYALEAQQGAATTAEAQLKLLRQIIASGFEGCRQLYVEE